MTELSNSFNGKQLEGYLSEIFRHDDALASLRGQYMQSCREPRAAIKEIMGTVREAGINMVAFRQVLAEARSDRAHASVVAAMDQQDVDDYEAISAALGDFGTTPLGQATLARAAE